MYTYAGMHDREIDRLGSRHKGDRETETGRERKAERQTQTQGERQVEGQREREMETQTRQTDMKHARQPIGSAGYDDDRLQSFRQEQILSPNPIPRMFSPLHGLR